MNNQTAQTMPSQKYRPELGVYDEESLRLAHKAWESLEYLANADESGDLNHEELNRRIIAIERAIEAHPYIIDENDQYVPSALSQPAGVPDGWKLVPVKLTNAMWTAGNQAMSTREAWRAMLAAAPAASGGEEYRRGYAQGVADVKARPNYDDSGDTKPTPQPPTGASVSERARELLAQAYRDGGYLHAAKMLETGLIDSLDPCAIRAIEHALSSPRQEGKILARGWFHALPECDDYEFHDDASGAGKNCGECIRAMIVTEDSTAASTQGDGDGWVENFRYLLDRSKYTLRSREGGGAEDLMQSAILTFTRMESLLTSPTTGADGGGE